MTSLPSEKVADLKVFDVPCSHCRYLMIQVAENIRRLRWSHTIFVHEDAHKSANMNRDVKYMTCDDMNSVVF